MLKTKSSIRDGYTRRAYIAPDGNHTGLMFAYRPTLPDAVDELLAKTKSLSPTARLQAIASHCVAHISEWSEVDDADNPVPISVETFMRLPWKLVARTEGIITGFSYSDLPPDYTDDELARWSQSQKANGPPGIDELVADRKN